MISSPIKKLSEFETKAVTTVYYADTDGFVIVLSAAATSNKLEIGNTVGVQDIEVAHSHSAAGSWGSSFHCPVKKGQYWKVTVASGTPTIYWCPLK